MLHRSVDILVLCYWQFIRLSVGPTRVQFFLLLNGAVWCDVGDHLAAGHGDAAAAHAVVLALPAVVVPGGTIRERHAHLPAGGVRCISSSRCFVLGLRWESWTESILCYQAQIPAILHGAPIIQVALYPDIPVPSEVGVEHPHELLDRDPGPVAAVEEFYLQPSEEALAPRVIGTASLPRHRSDQAVLIAYPYPSRPAVMAAAVRVDLGMVALAEPLARAVQRRVGHLGVGRRGDRPAQRHAVEAVHDGREVHLAGGDAELGHVGDPQLVGLAGMEVVPAPLVAQQVLGRLGYLALVGAVAPPLLGGAGGQPPRPS